jgi:hypothetical protein
MQPRKNLCQWETNIILTWGIILPEYFLKFVCSYPCDGNSITVTDSPDCHIVLKKQVCVRLQDFVKRVRSSFKGLVL